MNSKQPNVIAHRGGGKWAPENTLAAFKKCLEANVFAFELDVQRCKSGELVVIHHPDVSTTTDGHGLVKDLTLSELAVFSAGKYFGEEFAGERIPTLQQVLDLVAGKLVINIEVKNAPWAHPNIEDDVIAALSNYAHRDKIIISSFDHPLLKRLAAKAPDLRIALLVNAILHDTASYAAIIGAKLLHPFYVNVRPDVVADAHAAGLELNVWTLNEKSEWALAVAACVDGICTDDPAGLTAFLAAINQATSCDGEVDQPTEAPSAKPGTSTEPAPSIEPKTPA